MNQIQKGLFAIEESMPCNPRDLMIGRYKLPATLQRAEREEAAARIITFSQQLDRWVGVSWSRLGQMMHEDYEKHRAWNEVVRKNHEEELRFAEATRKYRTLSIITLGIYALFVKKPSKQIVEVSEFDIPFSGIFMFGAGHVMEGIHELVESGMLRYVQAGEGDDAQDIFFPTPALISTIMEKQKPVNSLYM
jgi:hypothetical protein